ncbi:MAG: Asp-tRNA(Asn)/Glu-tRNA(Gln) amidotransferase GatCAB subunit B, partial [Dehalococcoidales bacterium]|nr:Asp-tRNA(Asn)/Glu-tRNA(Gln) amidotransferase GatCAB subunit B [Dehalococcoidales bacterium]
SKAMADYFEGCHLVDKTLPAKNISNWLLGAASAIMNATGIEITEFGAKVSPEQFTRLAILESQAVVNAATAKSVLEEMYRTGDGADEIIKRQGLSQISDRPALEAEVVSVISNNEKAVADYEAGKTEALKFLVGQVMRATKGRANPGLVSELLKGKLEGK